MPRTWGAYKIQDRDVRTKLKLSFRRSDVEVPLCSYLPLRRTKGRNKGKATHTVRLDIWTVLRADVRSATRCEGKSQAEKESDRRVSTQARASDKNHFAPKPLLLCGPPPLWELRVEIPATATPFVSRCPPGPRPEISHVLFLNTDAAKTRRNAEFAVGNFSFPDQA